MKPWQGVVKRGSDLILATLALIVSSPFLLIIAILVGLTSAGPVLFRQLRLGKGGVPFTLYKFRSMYHGVPELKASDGSNLVLKEDPRITPAGRFLRAFSLDELPQLLNVLKGDMSLVGPRCDQVDHLSHYTPEEHRKLEVKPGLTGLAMIKGRNILPWSERIRLDIWYIDHYSLRLDLKIILQTIPVLLFCKGVYSGNEQRDREGAGRA